MKALPPEKTYVQNGRISLRNLCAEYVPCESFDRGTALIGKVLQPLDLWKSDRQSLKTTLSGRFRSSRSLGMSRSIEPFFLFMSVMSSSSWRPIGEGERLKYCLYLFLFERFNPCVRKKTYAQDCHIHWRTPVQYLWLVRGNCKAPQLQMKMLHWGSWDPWILNPSRQLYQGDSEVSLRPC